MKIVLIISLCCLVLEVPAVDKILLERREKAAALTEGAEKLRPRQPDFADWVKYQKEIYENFEKSLRYDWQYDKERFQSVLADYDYLLKRMTDALEYFGKQADPDSYKQFNVHDFGAKGDGVTDDAGALLKTFDAAGEQGKVFIPKGRYLLKNQQHPAGRIFHLKDRRNLLIYGEEGTVLVTAIPRNTVFYLEKCDNVQLRNLHITAGRKFFTTGVVTKVENPDKLIVKIDDNELAPDDPIFAESNSRGLARFADGRFCADGRTPLAYSVASHFLKPEVKKLENGMYEFSIPKMMNAGSVYQPGLRMVYYARDYGNQKIILADSNHCRLNKISLDISASMAFLGRNSEAAFITDCVVAAGDGFPAATAADGFYFYNACLGSYIANNRVRDLGDDFLNIHTLARPLSKIEGDTIYLPVNIGAQLIQDMTRIGLYRDNRVEKELQIVGKPVVEQNMVKIKLKEPPAGLSLKDRFIFPELQNHGTVIAGNIFTHGVSRILPGGRNCLLADNRIEDNLGWKILVQFGQRMAHLDEVFMARNVSLKRNVFSSLHKSVIYFAKAPDNDFSRGLSHIYLEENTFNVEPYGKNDLPLFQIRGVDHIQINHNTINASGGQQFPVIEKENVRGLEYQNNRLPN